jgi:hypothetical protein
LRQQRSDGRLSGQLLRLAIKGNDHNAPVLR